MTALATGNEITIERHRTMAADELGLIVGFDVSGSLYTQGARQRAINAALTVGGEWWELLRKGGKVRLFMGSADNGRHCDALEALAEEFAEALRSRASEDFPSLQLVGRFV